MIYAGTSVGDDGEIMVGSSATNNLIDTTVGMSIKGDGTTSFATFTYSEIINGDALKDKNIKFAINSQNGRDGDNIIVIGETQTNGVRNFIYIEYIGGYIPDLDWCLDYIIFAKYIILCLEEITIQTMIII